MAMVAGDPTIAASAQQAMRRRIYDCVAERYAEAQLAASDVASALNFPEQAVHVALAARAQTFAALLFDVRLERAAQLLEQSALEHFTLADIAKQVGFVDSTPLANLLEHKLRRPPA
jgi:AraC-like DNA-binding protein